MEPRKDGIDEYGRSEIADAPRASYRRGGGRLPLAFRALQYAADQAANTGSALDIVTVYNGPLGYAPFTPVVLDQEGAESVVREAIDKVHESHPGVVIKGEVICGAAGPLLSEVSEGASALVVGTRGHGQIVGALLGSVSEYVVHHAHCTTTIVH